MRLSSMRFQTSPFSETDSIIPRSSQRQKIVSRVRHEERILISTVSQAKVSSQGMHRIWSLRGILMSDIVSGSTRRGSACDEVLSSRGED